jgi:hypothetical protein
MDADKEKGRFARKKSLVENRLKARLHGRFLLRFSPFGGYEGVDYLMTL